MNIVEYQLFISMWNAFFEWLLHVIHFKASLNRTTLKGPYTELTQTRSRLLEVSQTTNVSGLFYESQSKRLICKPSCIGVGRTLGKSSTEYLPVMTIFSCPLFFRIIRRWLLIGFELTQVIMKIWVNTFNQRSRGRGLTPQKLANYPMQTLYARCIRSLLCIKLQQFYFLCKLRLSNLFLGFSVLSS